MHLSLPWWRAEWRIFCFQESRQKSSFLCLWVPRGHGESRTDQHRITLILLSCQQAVREHHQSPYSCTLCQTMEPGKLCTAHSNPASVRPRSGSLHSTSLPHHGYVGGPTGPACTVSGCLVALPSLSVVVMPRQVVMNPSAVYSVVGCQGQQGLLFWPYKK